MSDRLFLFSFLPFTPAPPHQKAYGDRSLILTSLVVELINTPTQESQRAERLAIFASLTE